jgi:CRISPR-associated exonuclease Cas4
MEYAEDNYLMLSGIQHFKFCRRQWALIHIEQQWAENVHTVVGELMHKKAHDPCIVEKKKRFTCGKVTSGCFKSPWSQWRM